MPCSDEYAFRVGGIPSPDSEKESHTPKEEIWLAPVKSKCVSEGELRYNVAMYENRIGRVETYKIEPGTVVWVGRVAHGPADLAVRGCVQFYINFSPQRAENPFGKVRLVAAESLRQDLFVSGRTGNA